MEVIVWLINVLNAFITPTISTLSKSAQKQTSGGASSAAQTATTPLTSNLSETIKLDINWTEKTLDGLMGKMEIKASGATEFSCVCITNLADRILDGTYTAVVDLSPHLQYMTPHLRVPLRDQAAGGDAGLRIHILNDPCQSLGCIGPGETVDGDAVDDSKDAFDALMTLLPQDGSEFTVTIATHIEIQ
jgi:hypothetical protein